MYDLFLGKTKFHISKLAIAFKINNMHGRILNFLLYTIHLPSEHICKSITVRVLQLTSFYFPKLKFKRERGNKKNAYLWLRLVSISKPSFNRYGKMEKQSNGGSKSMSQRYAIILAHFSLIELAVGINL